MSKNTALARQFQYLYNSFSPRPDSDVRVSSQAIAWLQQNGHEKFFLYLHIMSPHADYPAQDTDDEFLAQFDPRQVESVRKRFSGPMNPNSAGWSPTELRILQGLYDSSLKHADRCVGALYDAVEKLRLAPKTVFLITADHGENLGDHGRIGHGGTLWDSILHVPLILSYPPRIPAGTMVQGMAESVAIMPTFLDLAGIHIPSDQYWDGRSLLPLILQQDRGRQYVVSVSSLRTEKYKYITEPESLYDLQEDPGETKDLLKKRRAMADELRGLHQRLMGPYLANLDTLKAPGPPAEAFFFKMNSFNIISGWSGRATGSAAESSVLPWIVDNSLHAPKITRNPAASFAPPLVLSCPLPNGDYQVSALMQYPSKESPTLNDLGLSFRFSSKDSYRPPFGVGYPVEALSGEAESSSFSYLELGRTRIVDERFYFELSIPSPPKVLFALRHMRFVPAAAPAPTQERDVEEQRRMKEMLMASGYLSE